MIEILEINYEKLLFWAVWVLMTWGLMIIAVLIDMWTGIETAKTLKERIHSGGLRKTFKKASEYWRVQIMLFCFDLLAILFDGYFMPFASTLGMAGVLTIEMISVRENLKRRKSHASEIIDIAQQIVGCTSTQKAVELIKKLNQDTYLSQKRKDI